ncbi:MAG: hypothetical protein U1A72_08890 [Sulfuritalea sp.]|nr:hypothetical protein [Sulfuritalea sp.]
MNITKRLEALEAVAMKAEALEKFDVIRVIVAPDRSIVNALRRGEGGALVPVSEDELAHIRCAD